jgi:hypothetical protein
MTLARKRKVGSLSDIDRGQTRFNDATRTPVFFLKSSRLGSAAPGSSAEN